ncbi:MAG TPA: GlsB/YeaQ/YmgE family stress response membrane protein [Candidatus Levybacteria bacterium]|nr:GlsB/YeaQ/YmgE family stress response membrane protein [Candidatus Levybacteria bacterium]
MTILLWIVFGAIAGFIADMIDKSVTLNWIERIIVGVVGAVVGGTLYYFLTTGNFDVTASAGFDLVSLIVAVLGALLALFVYKRVRK